MIRFMEGSGKSTQRLMYLTLLMTLLLTLSHSSQSSSSGCVKCVNLTISSCRICYNDCGESPQFQSCSKVKCKTNTQKNRNKNCTTHPEDELSEDLCFSTCGCNEQLKEFSLEELNSCKKKDKAIVIVMICGGILFIVLLFIFVLCCLCGCVELGHSSRDNQEVAKKYEIGGHVEDQEKAGGESGQPSNMMFFKQNTSLVPKMQNKIQHGC